MTLLTTETADAVTAPTRAEPLVKALLLIALGLAVGTATAILQTYLDAPWSSLTNAASPWVAAAFVGGMLWQRLPLSAVAGAVACLLEVVGYYGTDHLRGYPAAGHELVFWGACALLGGPVFGAAGWAWRQRAAWLRRIGATALPAIFLAEAVGSYAMRLHYWSSAVLFAALGVALAAVLGAVGERRSTLTQRGPRAT